MYVLISVSVIVASALLLSLGAEPDARDDSRDLALVADRSRAPTGVDPLKLPDAHTWDWWWGHSKS
jgi:hypothetical protein